jgi:hypothetical protein
MLALVIDGELRANERGWAAVRDGAVVYGDEALALARLAPWQAGRRYWAKLDEQPLLQPLAGCRSAADLVHGQLQKFWSGIAGGVDRVVLAVPPAWAAPQLGLLLGIARDAGIPVAGLVESAVAASRRPYSGRALWHLELLLNDAWLTRLDQQPSAVAAGARERIAGLGVEALERVAAEFIARRFVECARFDPLHDAATEQRLYQQLPDWLARLARQPALEVAFEHKAREFRATVPAEALRAALSAACEPLLRRLRTLVSPREPAVLQLHAVVAPFPGVIEALAGLANCNVVVLEPAAAARGASRLAATGAQLAQNFRLVSTLPWDQPAIDGSELPAAAAGGAPPPTHVLFEGRAWRLGATPVLVGTELAPDEYGIGLDHRSQGISRRHCTLQVEDGRVVLHDQSRYGTMLNGHRITGSAVLQAGDVVTIGQPARELRLIVEVAHGA